MALRVSWPEGAAKPRCEARSTANPVGQRRRPWRRNAQIKKTIKQEFSSK